MQKLKRILITLIWIFFGAIQVSCSVSCIGKLGPLSSPSEESMYYFKKEQKINQILLESAEFVDGFRSKYHRLPTSAEYYGAKYEERRPEFFSWGDLPEDLSSIFMKTVPENEYYLSYYTDNQEAFFYYTSWDKNSTASTSPPSRYENAMSLLFYLILMMSGVVVIGLALDAFFRKNKYLGS